MPSTCDRFSLMWPHSNRNPVLAFVAPERPAGGSGIPAPPGGGDGGGGGRAGAAAAGQAQGQQRVGPQPFQAQYIHVSCLI